MIGGQLYRRSYSGSYLRCLDPEEAKYVISELCEGVCENHLGGRTFAHRTCTQGYYWPTIHKDSQELVRTCDSCQRYAHIPWLPSKSVTLLVSPLLFAQWIIDIMSHFLVASS